MGRWAEPSHCQEPESATRGPETKKFPGLCEEEASEASGFGKQRLACCATSITECRTSSQGLLQALLTPLPVWHPGLEKIEESRAVVRARYMAKFVDDDVVDGRPTGFR